MRPETYANRCLAVVETGTMDCIIWPGYLDKLGYGRARIPGRRTRTAHNVVYELVMGPVPDGLQLDHECFTPSCVNPRHMTPRTPLENMKRRQSSLATECSNGHPYTPETSYREKTSGWRRCRICGRAAAKRYAAKKRAGTVARVTATETEGY